MLSHFFIFIVFLFWIFVGPLFIQPIFALSSSFIKRARLYFSMLEELKKRVIPPLCSHEGEMKGKNLAFETGELSFSFAKSMALEPKTCKILLFISIIIAVLWTVSNIVFTVGWKSDARALMLLLGSVSICVFFMPIIGLLCLKVTRKLKKTSSYWKKQWNNEIRPFVCRWR